MMGDSKPNFALDLSNERVALWHRSSGGGWTALGNVSLAADDFSAQFAALRDGSSKGTGRARRALIRIPRSEVLLSKVRVGVFEGEAAVRHAHKQIAELSPYQMNEIAFDLGEKGFGNMAPVGIVARQTLVEAEAFARSNGFDPLYFTTQYTEKEFTREPRFYTSAAKPAAKPLWYVPWVAAASVGLALGYFGYTYATAPNVSKPISTAAVQTAVVETVEPTPEPEPQLVDTTQLGLQDVAPALPSVAVVLAPPQATQYPEMLVAAIKLSSDASDPEVTRLQAAQADVPQISISSKQAKTSDLQIAEARRDLPNVSVNDEIVAIIQSDMTIATLNAPEQTALILLAALTAPNEAIDPALLINLPRSLTTDTGVNSATTQPAARPVRPPSTITAAPGTLIPTIEGTPGPEYITIFAGRPANPPRNRIDPVPPQKLLAGFRPRLRPATLNVPAELVAAVEPEIIAEPTILDLADPALRPLRARLRPSTLVVPQVVAPSEVLVEVTPEETTPEVVEEPNLFALADPALAGNRARLRPEILADRAAEITAAAQIATPGDPTLRPFRARLRPAGFAPIIAGVVDEPTEPATDLTSIVETAIAEVAIENPTEAADEIAAAIAQDTVLQTIQDEASTLAFSNPALRPFRARTRPSGLLSPAQLASLTTDGAETQTDAAPTLLALADPTLAGVRARTRPSILRVVTPEQQTTLLALADPTLAGKRTRARPSNLRVLQPEPETSVIEDAIAKDLETVPETPVIRGTRLAVAVSPKPKTRPGSLARVVERVTREAKRSNASVQSDSSTGVSTSGGSTRATAKLPKSAKGTVKSAPPVNATVARAATEKSHFKKSRMNLVGIFGAPNKRRALIRLSSGRYVKVQNGDKVSGWKVSAIGESSLRIKKGSRDQVLRIP